MVNHAVIKECLFPLIGFKQTIDKRVERIDADIVISTADLYVDHALLSVSNIIATQEKFNEYVLDEWSNTIPYKKGALVYKLASSVKKYYICQIDNTGNDPEVLSINWKPTTLVSIYLRSKFNDSISKVVNKAITNKQLNGIAKGFYGEVKIFEGSGSMYDREAKNNRFVGFILRLNHQDTNITLKKIGLQFDTANPTFKLYVYHSSRVNPIYVIDLAHTNIYDFQWLKIEDKILSFASDSVNFGGEFYIGYYEQDLLGQAINKKYDFEEGCGTCDPINASLFNKWNEFTSIQPFYVNNESINYTTKEIWPKDKEMEVSKKTFGLNFVGSMNCDLTDLFCRNTSLFANALKLQIEVDLLRDMAFGIRENGKHEEVRKLAMYALDNRENHTKGILKELENALDALDFNTGSISAKCLPCSNKAKLARITSVWR